MSGLRSSRSRRRVEVRRIATAPLVVALVLSCAGRAAAGPASIDAAGARGRAIYTTGASPGGSVPTAVVAGGIDMPATTQPCSRCHGTDGRGRTEGGVRMPKVWWSHLTAPSGVQTYLGGVRPPYTDATVARAIREGLDSAGAPLDGLMPRYDMDDGDLGDLLAYLKAIETEQAPGVDATMLRIGTLLPASGPAGAQGRTIHELLMRYFRTVNEAGGIHGRRIEIVAADPGATVESTLAAARDLATGPSPVFCILTPAAGAAAPQMLRLLADAEVPVLGALTFDPDVRERGSVFQVLPSFADQGRAAATWLSRRSSGATVALVSEPTDGAAAMAGGFESAARSQALSVIARTWEPHASAADMARQLRDAGASSLVLLGGGGTATRILDAAGTLGWEPEIMVSTVLLDGRLDTRGKALILIAPPFAPGAGHPGAAVFQSLVRAPAATGPSLGHGALEMAAFAAAELLADALKRMGREVRRSTLVDVLADARDVETGVSPPVSYGPNRRDGLRGALMIQLDVDGKITVNEWIDVAPGS